MKRLAIIAALLLVAAVATYFVVTRKASSSKNGATNTTINVPVNSSSTNAAENGNINVAPSRDQMLAIARLFAERYGTVTTANPNANLDSVMLFASDALKATFVRMEKSNAGPSATKVTTTSSQALTFSIRSFDQTQGRGEVSVTLQRKEQTDGLASPRNYTQTLLLTFVIEHGAWKVSVAAWGPAQ